MWIKLFYDKYIGTKTSGRHDFTNPITSKINLDDLEDGSFQYYTDKQALDIYNSKFKDMPNNILNNSQDFLKIHLYKKNIIDPEYNKQKEELEIILTIISINTKLLEKYILNKNIPYEKFIKDLCGYHRSYQRENKWNILLFNSLECKQKIQDNIQFIINTTIEPANYSLDEKISPLSELTIKLFEYQKCSINWMINLENNKKKITYNLSDEVFLNSIYYDINSQAFKFVADRKYLVFHGGALVDEVGLGKTIQIISLAIKNPSKITSYIIPEIKNKFYSRATLVFCPNQLCGQWLRELKDKIKSSLEPKIVSIMTKRDYDKITYTDILEADFIIVSFTFLNNPIFTKSWVPLISKLKKFNCQEWTKSDIKNLKLIFENFGIELLKDQINSLTKTGILFPLIHFHRIVIDEFHEIYSNNNTYKYISNLLPFITGDYRWVVTATPFNQSENLYHITNFITGYTNIDDNYIFLVDPIIDYLSASCFRRNTKASISKEYTIPSISEEIRWLKFTSTERAMYNAYLADPNNNRFSVYLRQLCCHPQLAEETRATLSNCKSLVDIEKMMVSHYKIQVESAQEKLDKINFRISKIEEQIQIKEQKKAETKSELIDLQDLFEDNSIIDIKTIAINKLKEILQILKNKQTDAQNILDGKQATLNFFTTVVEKIKKTTTKTQVEDENICGVCLSEIDSDNLGVTQCGHIFCYDCITITINKYHSCPYCKKSLNPTNYYRLSYEKEKPKIPDSKEKLINLVGTKLAHLINFLQNSEHTIIFSQWDDLLKRIGRILKENNIENVFCKGNCYQRDKAIRDFNQDDKIKIIMLSSDSTAAGTNLTKATQVIFIDPIYGDYKYRKDQERQAIGRAHRLGQKSNIRVIRFIIRDSVEEEIHKLNKEEDKLHEKFFEITHEIDNY